MFSIVGLNIASKTVVFKAAVLKECLITEGAGILIYFISVYRCTYISGSNGRDSRLDESPKQKLELPGWFKNTRVPEVKNRWKPFKTSYRTDKTMVTPGFTVKLFFNSNNINIV